MGQLTLTRRPGQSLVIETLTGETICTVTTIKIEHGRTTVVLEGPPAVVFRRAELPSVAGRVKQDSAARRHVTGAHGFSGPIDE
jgi:sRNA-binding carbon storage regulator CsrA